MGEGSKHRIRIEKPPEGAMPDNLLREAVARQNGEGSPLPPPDLPIEEKEGKDQAWLEDGYIELIEDYYKKLFFEEDNLTKVLKENGLKTLAPWVKETRKLLKTYEVVKECLKYTLEILQEKYKDRTEELESAVLNDELDQIPEIKRETAKAILVYYEQTLEAVLERTKAEKNRTIINAELEKVKNLLGEETQDKDAEKNSFEEAIKNPEEKELYHKIKTAVDEEMKLVIDRINIISDESLMAWNIDLQELQQGIQDLQKEEIQEIYELCFEKFKKDLKPYWSTPWVIKEWAESYAQSAFTVWGNEAMAEAYKRAFKFTKGVSREKSKRIGRGSEELERAYPKGKAVSKDGEVRIAEGEVIVPKISEPREIERIFDREGRMETINKVIGAILSVHQKLLEDSKRWEDYKDLPDAERIQSVTIDTKANIINIYDKLLIQKKGFPSGEKFKRAFYEYAVSKIPKR